MNTFSATDAALERAGLRAIDIIRTRTYAGIGADGKPLAAYSPMYALLKAATHPQQGGTVTMSSTGAMLRALAVLRVGNNVAIVGADNAEDALKLLWHNATGAGRSRVIRLILGLNEEERRDETLIEILSTGVIIEGSFI